MSYEPQLDHEENKTIYKEDIIIFGKVLCTWCGSFSDLMYIEVSKIKPKIHFDTVICRECYKDIPHYEESEE